MRRNDKVQDELSIRAKRQSGILKQSDRVRELTICETRSQKARILWMLEGVERVELTNCSFDAEARRGLQRTVHQYSCLIVRC